MNVERLLKLYEQISEAPDAIARLRRFVLDLAVRGKLVEQDTGDEPASILMENLQAKRQRLIADGTMRAAKKLQPLKHGDLAFDAPNGWIWVRANDLWDFENGDRSKNYPSRDQLVDKGIPFINAGHLQGGMVSMIEMNFITTEKFAQLGGGKVKTGDQLYCLRGSLGKHARYTHDFPGAIASSLVILRPVEAETVSYLSLYLDGGLAEEMLRLYDNGTAQPNLSAANLRKFAIPLPPLAEQHRIVAKVDELMALCDRLEEARKTREEVRDKLTAASLARLTAPDTTAEDFPTHAAFALEALPSLATRPDQIKTLRQTILNLAVRGKLVEQDPADEPAYAALAKIAEARDTDATRKSKRARGLLRVPDTDALALPNGWESVRLSDIAISMRYGTSTKCGADASLVPVLRIPNVSSGRVTLDDMKFGPLNQREHADLALASGDLLMIRSNGSLDIVGRSAVVPTEANGMAFAGYLVRLRTAIEHVNTTYVWTAMNSQLVRDQIEKPIRSAVGLKNVNLTEFGNLSFWLPPLAEQDRIVAKVDALMALCDRLEAALTTADTTRARLLGALLHEALHPATDILAAAE